MTTYEELVRRGLIAQVTDEEEIKELINNGKATFYIGFDCTADSLTAGHFMALTLMKRLQNGWQPSNRTDRRRYHHDRRPIRPYRHEKDADQRGHRSQRRMLQTPDGAASSNSVRAKH